MSTKKLASPAVAIMFGAALIAAPAQAHGGGGHGGGGGGGFGGGPHGGSGGWGGGSFSAAAINPGFGGHPGFGQTSFFGHPGNQMARRAGFYSHRFYPHRRFVGRTFGFGFGGLYAATYSSCWTWVPTAFGWQQVWACGSPYGYDYNFY